MLRVRLVTLIVVVCVVIDQVTKHWAVTELQNGRIIDVVWTLRFALGFNSGFAFSQGQGWGPLVGLVALIVSVWIIRTALRAASNVMAIAFALIAGGAIGNLVDRMFREEKWMRGRVVDFIDFQWFPVFNIADSCITIGALVMVWALLFHEGSKSEGSLS